MVAPYIPPSSFNALLSSAGSVPPSVPGAVASTLTGGTGTTLALRPGLPVTTGTTLAVRPGFTPPNLNFPGWGNWAKSAVPTLAERALGVLAFGLQPTELGSDDMLQNVPREPLTNSVATTMQQLAGSTTIPLHLAQQQAQQQAQHSQATQQPVQRQQRAVAKTNNANRMRPPQQKTQPVAVRQPTPRVTGTMQPSVSVGPRGEINLTQNHLQFADPDYQRLYALREAQARARLAQHGIPYEEALAAARMGVPLK